MASLILDPTEGAGGQSFYIMAHNRPDIKLTRAANVTFTQVGVGGAIHVRIQQFRAISDELIEATVPPVGPAFTADQIIPASYRVFVELPGRIEESVTPFRALASAGQPAVAATSPSTSAAPTAPAPSIATGLIPITFNPSVTLPGHTLKISTPGGPVRVPLGKTSFVSMPESGTGKKSTSHHTCCCRCHCNPCCCSCCCDDHAVDNRPESISPPARSQPPRIPPPKTNPPLRRPSGAPASPTGPSSAQEHEIKFRWLVESSSPIREGQGPDLIKTSSAPDLYTDTMSGSTSNGGAIPVEPLPQPGGNPDNPPVRQFNFIVSTQVLSTDNYPLQGEKVTFRWVEQEDIAGDTSEILEVHNDLAGLKRKLIRDEAPNNNEYAYSNAEGKAYCWIRLKLYDTLDIADINKRLKGIKAIVGDVVRPATPPGTPAMHTMVRPGPAGTAGTQIPEQTSLLNILVDNLEAAVETFGTWIDGQLESSVGIPRTYQEVIGFVLKRIADGLILMFPLPAYSMALAAGFEDELRAMVIGLMLGVPRGIYVMGRDTVQDIGSLLFDLPRALFNFISEDPKFAMQVIGAVINPASGVVMYNLDPEFKNQINKAFSKFKGLLENITNILGTLWTSFRDQFTFSGIVSALGTYMYDEFSKFVGDIGTDYLRYKKDDGEYRHFVGGFIAGDFLGYIVTTIGVEVLLAWFTAGIGNMISIVSKLGRLGEVGALGLKVVRAFLMFIKKIEDLVGDAVAAIGKTVKNGIGMVLSGMVKVISTLLHPLGEHLIKPLLLAIFEATEEVQKKIVKLFYNWSYPENLDGAKLETLGFGLVNGVRAGSARSIDEIVRDTVYALSKMADDIDTPGGKVPGITLACEPVNF